MFWHAHLMLADMHIYGALVVYSDTVNDGLEYDEERILVLSDYWRESPESLFYNLVTAPVFKWIGAPASFLTNGKTVGENCTADHPSELQTTEVEYGKTYRFRIISAASLFATHFAIEGHEMTIVEVEGELIEPITVDSLELFSGQRYSVIIKANRPIQEYLMSNVGKWRKGAPNNGKSILKYVGSESTL